MSRTLSLTFVVLMIACQAEPATAPAAPETPLAVAKPQMLTRIDGRTYLATDPIGFPVDRIEVNKGGIRLSAVFQGAQVAVGPTPDSEGYTLTVAGSPSGGALPERVKFSQMDPVTGTLYWIAPGQAVPLWIGLYHGPSERHVIGPYPLTLVRTSHSGAEDGPEGAVAGE